MTAKTTPITANFSTGFPVFGGRGGGRLWGAGPARGRTRDLGHPRREFRPAYGGRLRRERRGLGSSRLGRRQARGYREVGLTARTLNLVAGPGFVARDMLPALAAGEL